MLFPVFHCQYLFLLGRSPVTFSFSACFVIYCIVLSIFIPLVQLYKFSKYHHSWSFPLYFFVSLLTFQHLTLSISAILLSLNILSLSISVCSSCSTYVNFLSSTFFLTLTTTVHKIFCLMPFLHMGWNQNQLEFFNIKQLTRRGLTPT